MTKEQFNRMLSNGSKTLRELNKDTNQDQWKTSKLESDPSHASLGQEKLQGASETAVVRIESVRKKLLDTDNICAKFVIDLLRYAGILYDDSPEQTSIQTTQRKCREEETEHTLIEIEINK